MARTNIEEESWQRIYRLAEIMDCSVREAAGTAACLWHRSQDILKTSGTRDELVDWCALTKISDEEIEKWFSALKKARLISPETDGTFLIHGNKTQIDSRVSSAAKAAKGGKALKKKWAEEKKLQAGSKPSRSRLQASSKPLNAMQFNAMQSKAIQSKAMQGNFDCEGGLATAPAPAEEPRTPVSLTWDSYKTAYETKYPGSEATKNATVMGQLAHFVKRVPAAEAPAIAAFYLTHRAPKYVNAGHSVGLLLMDAEKLRGEWQRGAKITSTDARHAEFGDTLANQLKRLGGAS